MARRHLAPLGGTGVLAALAVLARVLAPDRFDAAVEVGVGVVEWTPDPVVLGVVAVVSTVVVFVLLVYVIQVYYWAWLQVEPPVTRLWNMLLPESPIVRSGVGLIILVFVFLIGPLVVLQAVDFFENGEGPVEEQRTGPAEDDGENTTDDETENGNTASVHIADEPASPDEPPGSETHPSRVTRGSGQSGVCLQHLVEVGLTDRQRDTVPAGESRRVLPE